MTEDVKAKALEKETAYRRKSLSAGDDNGSGAKPKISGDGPKPWVNRIVLEREGNHGGSRCRFGEHSGSDYGGW
jgi:hypothetical protein